MPSPRTEPMRTTRGSPVKLCSVVSPLLNTHQLPRRTSRWWAARPERPCLVYYGVDPKYGSFGEYVEFMNHAKQMTAFLYQRSSIMPHREKVHT